MLGRRLLLDLGFHYSGFGNDSWSCRCRSIGSVVIGGLKRSLCRLTLTRFFAFFGALKTIAHPLAHVWFVTQLHISGNPASWKRTKAASLLDLHVWGGHSCPPLSTLICD